MIFKKKFLLLSLLIFIAYLSNAQNVKVTISGLVKDAKRKAPIEYANIVVKQKIDQKFITGTITDSLGRFKLADLSAGSYLLEFTIVGYQKKSQDITVGSLNAFLDLGEIILTEDAHTLNTVTVVGQSSADGLSDKMDKKTFTLGNNVAQSGGSVLQAMQNLPGVTLQDGKIQLRGNDKVSVLVDGKQNAMTGFGTQTGLDNIPASAIERIEIINNPSSKYDANGNQLWLARFSYEPGGTDYADAIHVDDSLNVYVTGGSYKTGNDYEFATVKYNPAGVQAWVAYYNGTGNSWDEAYGVLTDDSLNWQFH